MNSLLQVYDGEIEYGSKLDKITITQNEYITVNDKF